MGKSIKWWIYSNMVRHLHLSCTDYHSRSGIDQKLSSAQLEVNGRI